MGLIEDNIIWSRGEVANAAVCKTVMHGCKSHRDLKYCSSFYEGDDEVCCSYCMWPIASKKGMGLIFFFPFKRGSRRPQQSIRNI
jgi:hypothetical protein